MASPCKAIFILIVPLVLIGLRSQGQAPEHDAVKSHWVLDGVVTDPTGQPVPGATVKAVERFEQTATTDLSGHFQLEGTVAAQYGIYSLKDGYVFNRILRIQLIPGQRLHLNLELSHQVALVGRVVTDAGAPIADANVYAWVRTYYDGVLGMNIRGRARSDIGGRYMITGLSSGSYFLAVVPKEVKPAAAKGGEPMFASRYSYPVTFYPGVQSLDGASQFRLRPEEQSESLDLVVRRSQTYCARGVAPTSSTSSSLNLSTFISVSEYLGAFEYTIASGEVKGGDKFQICNLVPAIDYTVVVTALDQHAYVTAFGETRLRATDADVGIGFVDLGRVAMRSPVEVDGTIDIPLDHAESQSCPSGIILALNGRNPGFANETHDAIADASCRFVFPTVFPYGHRLAILGLPPTYYVKTATCGRDNVVRESWLPDCGAVHVSVGTNAAAISGRVVDEEGRPVIDTQVILASKDADVISARPVDVNGFFRVFSLPPGEYRLLALSGISEEDAQDPEVIGPYLSRAMELTLAPSANRAITLRASNIE